MTRPVEDVENILAAFAIEPSHDKATLDRYMTTYPDLQTDLLDLVLELELDGENDTPIDMESPLVLASWNRYSLSSTAPLTAKGFTKEVAVSIGVRTMVVMQLRDRAVQIASIPSRFLSRLAEALSTSVDELTAYLSEPRTLATGASYKADGKPSVGPQLTLPELLAQCGHSPDEIAQLLEEA
ncbi:hypothetical protein [Devosia rhizoryzae]|uniref:XRE family transcriptional regulator n=1 Tax=Devosia rhizoryzae TaxID=2774137 RepID=A0ABX7C460_9HYPH|nr:hypothetical protein [Devosia rhizoryzae]QQR39015.1 hypothetical protein JI748_14905 [Devosia rhizoryzae]